MRLLLTALATALLLACLGCGAPVGDTVSTDLTPSADRTASATFRSFFQDSVTNTSTSKWTVDNATGAKYWLLSNTYYNSPKAWVIGQNYWNGENDVLTSDPFQIPTVTYGIKLSFFTRFNIMPNDFGYVQVQPGTGADWQTLATYSNGTNAAWPNWNKVTLALPNNNGVLTNYRIRFLFTSNTSSTNWGWGIDNVSVYQTNVDPPTNLTASEDAVFITVDWDAPTNLAPNGYNIYRSTTLNGTYTFQGSVNAPDTDWVDEDAGGPGITYWYKVKAFKTGYLESAYSNADDGEETSG
jgi:hypothetical protein